jgi:hypothetical protein
MEKFGLFSTILPTPVLTALFTVVMPSLNNTAAALLVNPAWPHATDISNDLSDSEWPTVFTRLKGN